MKDFKQMSLKQLQKRFKKSFSYFLFYLTISTVFFIDGMVNLTTRSFFLSFFLGVITIVFLVSYSETKIRILMREYHYETIKDFGVDKK